MLYEASRVGTTNFHKYTLTPLEVKKAVLKYLDEVGANIHPLVLLSLTPVENKEGNVVAYEADFRNKKRNERR